MEYKTELEAQNAEPDNQLTLCQSETNINWLIVAMIVFDFVKDHAQILPVKYYLFWFSGFQSGENNLWLWPYF